MGLLTQLVQLKSQKDERALTGAIQGVQSILSQGPTPETKEWALGSLQNLVNAEFGGGGGKGKSTGGSAGGKGGGQSAGGSGAGGGIGDFFKHILSGLTFGRSTQLSEENQRGKRVSEAVSGMNASRPKQLSMTEDEKLALKQRIDQAELQAKLKQQEAIARQQEKLKLEFNQQAYEQEYDRLLKAGVPATRAAEQANAFATGRAAPAEPRPAPIA